MKQSTFSAFVANSIKNLLQGYTKGIRFTAILTLLFTIGVGQVWAGYNVNWKGNIFFRVPDNWDISTYSTIQLAVARTTSTSTNTYIFYFGTMTRVGSTRLYHMWASADHSGWGQNEYVFFTANNSTYGSGDFKINANKYYTTPINYDFKESEFPYFYNPTSENNGATVEGWYGNSGNNYDERRNNLLQKAQTIHLYTNDASSNIGGSVKITGYYFTGNTSVGTSSMTSSSNNVSYNNVIGSTVTLTATAATGYTFEGWYTIASGGTAISTSATYSYTCKGETTLYARFKAIQSAVTLNANGGTDGTASVTATYGQAMPSATMPTREGHTFNGYFTATSGGTKYYNADGTSARTWNKTANTTLYAQWTINTYSVKWVVNGVELTGAQLGGATTIVNHGDKIATAPKVEVEDYCGDKFVGWVTAPIEGQLKDAPRLYPTVADIPAITGETTTFYAVFADYEE